MADLIEFAVENAKKPPRRPHQKQGGNGSGGGFTFKPDETFDKYAVKNGCFYFMKPSRLKDGPPTPIKLCNFTAVINEDVIYSDGIEDKNLHRITATRCDGRKFNPVIIPSSKVSSKTASWVWETYSTQLLLETGGTVGEHFRNCLVHHSQQHHLGDIPRTMVYQHTGWRKIDDSWRFLSTSGALNTEQLDESVQVEMELEALNGYHLPKPLEGEALKNASDFVLEHLTTFCPDKPHIGVIALAAIARAPLCEALEANFMIHFHGGTGSGKSSLVKIILNFFGDFPKLPIRWDDTPASIPKNLFACKDVITVIDDYKMTGERIRDQQLKATASRIIQAIGDGAGRNKLKPDSSNDKAYHHRGMVISTGEHYFENGANIGRNVILDMSEGDTTHEKIKTLETAAKKGMLDGLTSAYIHWLAGKYDEFNSVGRQEGLFEKMVNHFREEVKDLPFVKSHSRAPLNYANLVAALTVWLMFLQDHGLLSLEQRENLFKQWNEALKPAFFEQGEYQRDNDETERFFTLLRAILSAGKAHLSDSLKLGPPLDSLGKNEHLPYACGWRAHEYEIEGAKAMHDGKYYTPQGDCIGYYSAANKEIWLVQTTVYEKVQAIADRSGESFTGKSKLWREMGKRGVIKRMGSDNRTTVLERVAGIHQRVMIIDEELLMNTGDEPNQQQSKK